MKIIDLYIIRKFLTTFCFIVLLLLMIAFIIDLTEKLDNFIYHKLSVKQIIFDYYIYFFPWIGLMLAPFFVFIAVIYFNSNLCENSELIAIQNGKVSNARLLVPYLLCAFFLSSIFYQFNHKWLPKSNKNLFAFTDKYTSQSIKKYDANVHFQFNKDTFVYAQNWDNDIQQGYKFSMEVIRDKVMLYKLSANTIKYDTSTHDWKLDNWIERKLVGEKYEFSEGLKSSKKMRFKPSNFLPSLSGKETMTTPQLVKFIEDLRRKGSENLDFYIVEKYRRTAIPASTIILTMIAVTMTSKKRRNGMGIYIVAGLAMSGFYVFLQQFSTVFATKGNLSPLVGVWIPNIFFSIIVVLLLWKNSRR
jgi:lipopolysaccharide export system permease protein